MKNRALCFPSPKSWASPRQRACLAPPQSVRPWLYLPGSLTAQLRHCARNSLTVQVLTHHIGPVNIEERLSLGIRAGEWASCREVLLIGDGEPWVIARSILPFSALNGWGRHLRKLGNKPLGAALFHHRHIRRGPIEIAKSRDNKKDLWLRRSMFYLPGGRAILVAEGFLPELLTTTHDSKA